MDKQQTIALIERQLATGIISKEDLTNLSGNLQLSQRGFETSSDSVVSDTKGHAKNFIHVLYGIGAIIAVVGIGILVSQSWNDIGFFGRILTTLFVSVVSFVGGFVITNPENKTLSQVLFTISAVLAPLGIYVLLQEIGVDFSRSSQLIVAMFLCIIFGAVLAIRKHNILVLLTVGFGSWAYYVALIKVLGSHYYDMELFKWAIMFLGVLYVCIGRGYRSAMATIDSLDDKEKNSVQNVLYGFGALAILGSGSLIGGFFDFIFVGVILSLFYGSVYLKSKSMLTLSALFLIFQIIKLTSEYFVDSIGWPVALMGAGFLVIGIGYITLYLNKRFISGN